jgi:hypothetical protein
MSSFIRWRISSRYTTALYLLRTFMWYIYFWIQITCTGYGLDVLWMFIADEWIVIIIIHTKSKIMAAIQMHEFTKSSFIIIAIQSSPSQRTTLKIRKWQQKQVAQPILCKWYKILQKIYFLITMVKGHMYYKYGQRDAQLIYDKGSITTLSEQLCNLDSLRSYAF